jgi:gluconate 2-dehydrogenase subunit 3-like protein
VADKNQSETPGVSRRDIFQILGAVPAVAAVEAHSHMHTGQEEPTAPKGPYKRQTFDDHQWETVKVLCDLIIPADERSVSASQAGVPEFMDDWITFRTEQEGNMDLRAEIFGGLMWLDHESNRLFEKTFVGASVDQQKQLLDRVAYPGKAAKDDSPWVAFFTRFRGLTVGGFFSSKQGVADLPYLGNRAVAEWKGCDPKVWAIIEERMKTGYKGVLEAKPWGA